MTLTIDEVSVRVLSAPLSERVPMSFSALTARRSVLVTLRSGGLSGTGESWVNYPEWGWRERLATLDGLRPLVLGADASDPAKLMTGLASRLGGVARQWGAPGPVWQALSGIDMACWDLLGQARGRPVAELLAGGPVAVEGVPAYGSGVGPTRVAELTEHALELGLRAVKIKVGFGEETDLATLRDVRAAASGQDLEIFADANQAWDPGTARRMCGLLADHGVSWFEEPLDGDRLDELTALAGDTGNLDLAGGENVYGAAAYEERVASPAFAHIQPDPSKTAGISLSDAVGRMPGTARLSPHCYGGAPTLAASVHLVAAAERPGWVELDLRENPLRTKIAAAPVLLDGGLLRVPDGPGLGLGYDRTALDRYAHTEEITC
ncbi:mandelate racemase/muconate lactonizing enzyme family protein [Actinomadura vinacea]|uniref:Mandelate racemase/muconate lactonizing enzyme family protein n=1 Tax=Actinomadura vinacea TaxID=115336 RepID=A0ABP5W1D4_9ACTN